MFFANRQFMGAGGSADSMKISDVFILVGISLICAGFILHGWTETSSVDLEEMPTHTKTTNHFKGDKIEYTISSTNITKGSISVVNDNGEEIYSENFTLLEGDEISEKVSLKESGEYTTTITVTQGDGEVYIDIERVLYLDYIVYPVGAAILMLGLHKRKEENVDKSLDADLEG